MQWVPIVYTGVRNKSSQLAGKTYLKSQLRKYHNKG